MGVNVLQIFAGSYELTSETTNNRFYSVLLNFGYQQESGLRMVCKIDDGIDDKKKSGVFFKLGGKLYVLNILGSKPHKSDCFFGMYIVGSQYASSGIDKDNNVTYRSSGFAWGMAGIAGYTMKISNRLEFDIGGQLSFAEQGIDIIGVKCQDYQPGMGWIGLNGSNPYFQFIANLKFRIGKENQVEQATN